jgi:hypothetical protein
MSKIKKDTNANQPIDFKDNPETYKAIGTIYETILSMVEGLSYVHYQDKDKALIQSLQVDAFTLNREIFQLLVLCGIKEHCLCDHSEED